MVTFERAEVARAALEALRRQSRPPDAVTVVVNVRAPSSASPTFTHESASVIHTGANLGPAGGLAIGTRQVLEVAADDDWLVFVDDDDPPTDPHVLERLLEFAHHSDRAAQVGGVGLAGGRFDTKLGLLTRLPDDLLSGAVSVDYLGGNQFPCYRVGALRTAGPPRADLFFGFDDLELGLRLQRAGFELLVDGDDWLSRRRETGRAGLSARQAASIRRRSTWRRYYGARNLVWLSRTYGTPFSAVVTTARSVLLAAAADAWRSRSLGASLPALRGGMHGWRSQLGQTIVPADEDG